MRSIRVVPPARKRMSAPCCAVFACAAAPMAAAAFSGRWKSNTRIGILGSSGVVANVLDGGDDVGVGAAAADVAAHELLDVGIGGAAGFVQQGDGGHDL